MSCENIQQHIYIEPESLDHAAHEHIQACPNCGTLYKEISDLQSTLKKAINVPIPTHLVQSIIDKPHVISKMQVGVKKMSFAMAATVLLFVGMSLISTMRFNSMSDSLIAHVEHESQAFLAKNNMTSKKVNPMLAMLNYEVAPNTVRAQFAKICIVEGEQMMHLVYKNSAGDPITVIIMPHKVTHWKKYFNRKGYYGEIIPLANGYDMVVIGKPNQNIEGVQLHLLSNLHLKST